MHSETLELISPSVDSKQRVISSGEAINDALATIGQKNPDVLLFAEGVTDPSAIYGTTKGLEHIYGEKRIIEMPVAENGLCGVAIGAAMRGKRPIISFHRVEFSLLAMEQIINNAAKAHYSSNGQHQVPLVIRLVIGRGWGQGPAHSQSLESLFASIPGLKVLMPVFPADYKGMMISAVEDNNPVIIIEHRWTHYLKGDVPKGYYKSDISGPKKLSSGKDCTIVASSYSVIDALKATHALQKLGITVDLFDLRVIRPLNLDSIKASVANTGTLLVIDTGFKTLGIGSEIVAQVIESEFQSLTKPPIRMGLPDHPIPSSRGYMPDLYPDAEKIFDAALSLSKKHPTSNEQAAAVKETLSSNTIPIDIPDPSFQGPF